MLFGRGSRNRTGLADDAHGTLEEGTVALLLGFHLFLKGFIYYNRRRQSCVVDCVGEVDGLIEDTFGAQGVEDDTHSSNHAGKVAFLYGTCVGEVYGPEVQGLAYDIT